MRPILALGKARHQRAFSLIELMVAVAILSLLSASIPSVLSRFQPARRVTAAADRLAADLRTLQVDALAHGRVAQLEVNESGYSLHTRRDLEQVSLPATMQLELASLTDTELRRISFYPDGSASSAKISLRDSNRSASFAVSLTGAVRPGG